MVLMLANARSSRTLRQIFGMRNNFRLLACLIIGLCFFGCGGGVKGPATYPVSGKITLKGKPLADVNVEFISESFASVGKTDANGAYRLVQGAPAGESKIVIRKVGAVDMTSPDVDVGQIEATYVGNEGTMPNPLTKGSDIPLEYSNAAKTPLKYMVPEGGTDSANLDL